MVTLTDARLRNTVFQNVYARINTDKASYNTTGTPKVYGGDPDDGNVTFPYIVILPIKAPKSDYTVDTDRDVSTKTITIFIQLFALSNKDIDNLADGVSASMDNLDPAGMYIIDSDEDNGVVYPNGSKLKQKTLTYTYMRR